MSWVELGWFSRVGSSRVGSTHASPVILYKRFLKAIGHAVNKDLGLTVHGLELDWIGLNWIEWIALEKLSLFSIAPTDISPSQAKSSQVMPNHLH